MIRRARGLIALALVCLGAGAAAGTPDNALVEAQSAFSKLTDYSETIVVHETDGSRVEDRTYHILFKKPAMERLDITAGPGRGGGIVWLGGDKVKGHRGGLLSGFRLTLDLHDSQVVSLRGDSVDTGTIASMLDDFSRIKGTVKQGPGPAVDGGETIALTLDVADPGADRGVTREVLALSATTHLPVRRERFAGGTLVKSEEIAELKTDVGLTAKDFPW